MPHVTAGILKNYALNNPVGFHSTDYWIIAEIPRGFTQYFEANSGMVPVLGHDNFLPHAFEFIIHETFYP
jgi:hypothetical protein